MEKGKKYMNRRQLIGVFDNTFKGDICIASILWTGDFYEIPEYLFQNSFIKIYL